MVICRTVARLESYLAKNPGARGFIPTMGALHEGHLSLVREARATGSLTVCSIFVNPTQFNDPNDFRKYPRTPDKDLLLLEKQGVDVVFLPSVEEIYPDGVDARQTYDLGYLENILEGKYRPGHFQGVCRVVHRLLDIVRPTQLYMGLKDYQQCLVVRRLIDLMGTPVRFIACPTQREPDGLAMSSRNRRLDPAQRAIAPRIYETLLWMREHFGKGRAEGLIRAATEKLQAAGFQVDYVALANPDTLEALERLEGGERAQALVAAFLGDVRLIDNESL